MAMGCTPLPQSVITETGAACPPGVTPPEFVSGHHRCQVDLFLLDLGGGAMRVAWGVLGGV